MAGPFGTSIAAPTGTTKVEYGKTVPGTRFWPGSAGGYGLAGFAKALFEEVREDGVSVTEMMVRPRARPIVARAKT